MTGRYWFPRGAFALDYAARNRAGSDAAQRGSDKAAATRRRRTWPVTLARSAADEVPVALPIPARPVR